MKKRNIPEDTEEPYNNSYSESYRVYGQQAGTMLIKMNHYSTFRPNYKSIRVKLTVNKSTRFHSFLDEFVHMPYIIYTR